MPSVLDRLIQGVGIGTDVADEAAIDARESALGTAGVPDQGGLIPALESEQADRTDFLARFDAEKNRILQQTDVNRASQLERNELAAAQLPALGEAATPEGFTSRIDALSGSAVMQRVLERGNQQRQRAVAAQASAGGLQRSGAAAQAAANATLTNEEFAIQTEQTLFDRSLRLTDLHENLPVANRMVADTFNRDISIARNLEQQGTTRANTDLLMGQISSEATDRLLDNLENLITFMNQNPGSSPTITIVNEIVNEVTNTIDGMIAEGVGWLEGAVSDVIGEVFSDFSQGGEDSVSDSSVTFPPFDPNFEGDFNLPSFPSGEESTIPPEDEGAVSNPDDVWIVNSDGTMTNQRTGETKDEPADAQEGEGFSGTGERIENELPPIGGDINQELQDLIDQATEATGAGGSIALPPAPPLVTIDNTLPPLAPPIDAGGGLVDLGGNLEEFEQPTASLSFQQLYGDQGRFSVANLNAILKGQLPGIEGTGRSGVPGKDAGPGTKGTDELRELRKNAAEEQGITVTQLIKNKADSMGITVKELRRLERIVAISGAGPKTLF